MNPQEWDLVKKLNESKDSQFQRLPRAGAGACAGAAACCRC